MGSLFIKNFKREPIFDKTHFLNVIVYTHRNPVHHGFCKSYEDWDFSSYNDIVNGVSELAETGKLLKMTDGLESFTEKHMIALENVTPIYELEYQPKMIKRTLYFGNPAYLHKKDQQLKLPTRNSDG